MVPGESFQDLLVSVLLSIVFKSGIFLTLLEFGRQSYLRPPIYFLNAAFSIYFSIVVFFLKKVVNYEHT